MSLSKTQLSRLNELLADAVKRPFYEERMKGIELPIQSRADFEKLPLLTKDELVRSSDAGDDASRHLVGRCFDLPLRDYSRLHQTSGTKGHPMVVMDTASDWNWWLRCWGHVLDAGEVTSSDVAMMAFSFGPFIGFWTANDSLVQRGALVVPGGGLSTDSRLRMILDHRCTVVCCTPTYALHLATAAERLGIRLDRSDVRLVIVAGEPGGSIASIRSRISEAWGATVLDHAGGSEIGAWGFGSPDGRGLHVIESEFIAEVLHIDHEHPNGTAVDLGQQGELVLTNLGRTGGPAIRYRTGDVVRPVWDHEYATDFVWLDGGVLGRSDDMFVIRGVNLFPSSLEAIIREVSPASEFRIVVEKISEMDQVSVQIEGGSGSNLRETLEHLFKERLAMRIDVEIVHEDALPRFEAKAKRVVDRRGKELP